MCWWLETVWAVRCQSDKNHWVSGCGFTKRLHAFSVRKLGSLVWCHLWGDDYQRADWPKGKGPIIVICSLWSGEIKANSRQSLYMWVLFAHVTVAMWCCAQASFWSQIYLVLVKQSTVTNRTLRIFTVAQWSTSSIIPMTLLLQRIIRLLCVKIMVAFSRDLAIFWHRKRSIKEQQFKRSWSQVWIYYCRSSPYNIKCFWLTCIQIVLKWIE